VSFKLRGLALAAAAFPLIAAAESPEATVELAPVQVQASPLGQTADELVHPVDVLSGAELQRRQRGTIGDVLADRPGVSNANFGPGVGRPVLRGQGGGRVQVLENGIGSMDASTISADHAVASDPLNADQVEVIKGPATLIYGGGASAGVVNIVDDRLPDTVTPGLQLRSDLSYGDNGDERNGALKARYGTSALQLGAQYARRKANDFSIPGFAERQTEGEDGHEHEGEEPAFGTLANSSLDTESYGASAAWAGERGMFGAALSRYETNYGIPGHAHEHEHEEGEGEEAHSHEGIRIDLEQTRLDLRGVLNSPLPGFEKLEARAGVNDYEHREVSSEGEVHTTFKVREFDSRVQLRHRPLAGWTGVAGLHLGNRDFEAIGEEAFVPPVETQGLGLFVVENREIGPHLLELGARVDRSSHEPDGGLADRDYTPLSLSAGINFLVAEHLHLRFNAQRAQRAPSAEELYAGGPHLATLAYERGNLDLGKETANNLDLSLSRDQGRWTWELGAFYNRINDYIFLREVDGDGDGEADRVDETGTVQADGELLLVDYRQQDAEFYGAEASAGYKLIVDGPFKLNLKAFGDTVRGQLKDDGGNLPRITPTRLGIGAEGSYGPFDGSLRYMRSQKQDRTAALETPTPGYDLLSADLAYTLESGSTSTTFYLQGRNLLDEKIRLSTSFLKDVAPLPGRSLFAGVRVDFQPPL
jgi:iron complex outermembrane receptor protein